MSLAIFIFTVASAIDCYAILKILYVFFTVLLLLILKLIHFQKYAFAISVLKDVVWPLELRVFGEKETYIHVPVHQIIVRQPSRYTTTVN